MNKVIDSYNMAVGGIIALLTAVFGAHWYIFAAFFVLNVFDWATGWYKARQLHRETSKKGAEGAMKKVGYWLIIAVAFLVSSVFVQMGKYILNIDLSFLTMVGWFTLACLLVNEARSILENIVECGYNVPAVLVNGLAITHKLINKEDETEEEP